MNDLAALESRLAALERSNRIMKRIAGACALMLVVVVAAGADVVTQDRITVQDKAGTARISAYIREPDRAVVQVHDKSGTLRAFLGENTLNSPMLVLLDAEGNDRIKLGFDDNGAPYLGFFDRKGKSVKRF